MKKHNFVKRICILLSAALLLGCFWTRVTTFTASADQTGSESQYALADVAGFDVYTFSFDWELLYPTTDQSEIYLAITAQEESYHHYLNRFVYGVQEAGTSGTVNVSYNFYGKCNGGNDTGHGTVVLAGAPVIQLLPKMIPAFAIDNFTIKKNGEEIFSTDFSDGALPEGLVLGNTTSYYGTIGVKDGKFVADSGQAEMDVNTYNYHMQVLKVDTDALDIAWCPGGVAQAGAVDGAYVVDNGGNAIGKDGAYFPVLQTNPDLLQIEWGKGYTYLFEFDYKRTYADDTAGDMHMQMVNRSNSLLKQEYVGNGNDTDYTHASFTLDANGDGANVGDTVILRVVGNQFKGMAFDNVKVTRIDEEGVETVLYDENFELADTGTTTDDPVEPVTQETHPQTGDMTMSMFAVIVVLALGAAVVFTKKKLSGFQNVA